MARYTADSRDRVRDAADMVAVVSERTELRRSGADSYVGRCPFHDERTGSFSVDAHKKLYHCFGCQASGDVFNFVMETEGLEFVAAMETLADRFGVTLETEDEDPAAAARRERRERLHALLGRTADYYARYLWEASEADAARTYLLGRGLTEETLRAFRVGYAPSAWDRILTGSRRAGFSEEELLATGLAQRSRTRPGSVFDRFRERIMFPSADARGRVLGFGARAMRENQPPKYLNTSDGELYHKRAQLFGIHLARAVAAKAGRMILVEGYTDVLALHQAGLRNAVGIMGTSLTEEQISELERVVGVVELCLDADRAGEEAMLRAATVAAGRRLELRVVGLPEGTDPAELIEREGADALRERVARSVPFAAFRVDSILRRAETGNAEGRDRAITALRPVLAELPASILREELVQRIAGRLDLSLARLTDLLDGQPHPQAPPQTRVTERRDGADPAGDPSRATAGRPTRVARPPELDTGARGERAFLVMCVAVPDAGNRALADIDIDELIRSDAFRGAAHHLAGRCERPLSDLPPHDDALARTVADLVGRAGRAEDVTLERLEHARLMLERARIDRAIRRARVDGRAGIADLARERESVLAAIHQVVSRLERTV